MDPGPVWALDEPILDPQGQIGTLQPTQQHTTYTIHIQQHLHKTTTHYTQLHVHVDIHAGLMQSHAGLIQSHTDFMQAFM